MFITNNNGVEPHQWFMPLFVDVVADKKLLCTVNVLSFIAENVFSTTSFCNVANYAYLCRCFVPVHEHIDYCIKSKKD